MKKSICLLLSLLFVLSMAACSGGETNNPYYSKDTGLVDLAALKGDMLKNFHISDPLDFDRNALLNQYGIQPEDVADLACFITLDGVFPQEIIMVRAGDAEAASRVKEHLQTRLEEFRVQSKDYDAENYAIAQKCSVLTNGVYVALFLTPDYDGLSKMFQAAMKF